MLLKVWLLASCFITLAGCSAAVMRDDATTIAGSWRLLQMSRTPVPVSQVQDSGLVGGVVEFKPDGTFAGEVKMPGAPGNVRMGGTYEVKDGVVVMRHKENGSVTASKVRIEEDILTMEPIGGGDFSFAFQYRRVK